MGGGVERANVSVGCICRRFASRTWVALVGGLVCPEKEVRGWAAASGKRERVSDPECRRFRTESALGPIQPSLATCRLDWHLLSPVAFPLTRSSLSYSANLHSSVYDSETRICKVLSKKKHISMSNLPNVQLFRSQSSEH
jgi:hypothetical protein